MLDHRLVRVFWNHRGQDGLQPRAHKAGYSRHMIGEKRSHATLAGGRYFSFIHGRLPHHLRFGAALSLALPEGTIHTQHHWLEQVFRKSPLPCFDENFDGHAGLQ
jgi:hypothetical protein